MKLLDTHLAYLIHKEALGNEQNYISVQIEIKEDNFFIVPTKNFEKFYYFNSGKGSFALVLEANDSTISDFELDVIADESYTEFEIVKNFEYKKLQSTILHTELSESVTNQKHNIAKNKL